jgi:type I restriction enzyme S subunit
MGLHEKVRISQAREEVSFNQDVKALVPRDIEANILLFALLDAQSELLERVESSGHGTGKLPTEVLLNHPIVLPPRPVQLKLGRVFDVMNDRIASSRAASRTLATLRDMLLPKLISGELRAPVAARLAARYA